MIEPIGVLLYGDHDDDIAVVVGDEHDDIIFRFIMLVGGRTGETLKFQPSDRMTVGEFFESMDDAPGNPSEDDVAAAAELSDTDRMAMIQTMVESLDSRLKDDPNNIEGWKRLVRSYVMLQQPDKAAEALSRGLAAFPADSENGKALIALARELGVSEEGKTQ